MPQINRIRVNNVKYNFGTQVYDDFMMRFSCKNTIYDLANGGGKSVLMLLLLQNLIPNCTLDEKQPIEKLFRTSGGSNTIHSLIEWKLDPCYMRDNYKYMTTGFCARKAKEEDGAKDTANIEYFNYCIFYREFGDNDIKNLPLSNGNERITYQGLKNYLRDLEKNDFSVEVKIFERKGDYQNFISRYGLFESQWEIIRGINKTEGHVRTYFETNYKTGRKVVEDLLIEEIIQKSFNNKTGISGEENDMAQTLLDIKDKLLELSRKKSEIDNYDRQIALIDNFAASIGGIRQIKTEKERVELRLLDNYAACRKVTAGEESVLERLLSEKESFVEKEAQENKNILVAKVMEEEAESDKLGLLIREADNRVEGIADRIASLEEELNRKEIAEDYKEYMEYVKLKNEVIEILNNRLRDSSEVAEELHSLAMLKKQWNDEGLSSLTKQSEEAEKVLETATATYEDYRKQLNDCEIQAAVLENALERDKKAAQEKENNLKKLLSTTSVLVVDEIGENVQRLREAITTKTAEQKHHETIYEKALEEKLQAENVIASLKGERQAGEKELEKLKAKWEQAKKDKERIDSLAKVYQANDYEHLKNTIYKMYMDNLKKVSDMTMAIEDIKEYTVSLKEGKYPFTGKQYLAIKDYLNRHYGSDVVCGREWFDSLTAPQKRDILKRVPFIDYCFVIKEDFERIKEDTTLKNFSRSSYVVPIVSEMILMETRHAVNSDYVVFGTKDLSFLQEEGKVASEIERAEEELEHISGDREKLQDKVEVISEDYAYVSEYITGKAAVYEEIAADIERLTARLQELEESLEDCERRKAAAAKEAGSVREQMEECSRILKEINAEYLELSRVQDVAEAIKELYEQINKNTEEYNRVCDDKNELSRVLDMAKEEFDEAKAAAQGINSRIEDIEYTWSNLYAPYYVETAAAYTKELSEDELESKFRALKSIVEKENVDISDKETLIKTYEAAMAKALRNMEYKGMSVEEAAKAYNEGRMQVCDRSELMGIKEKISHHRKELDSARQELEAQSAQMNRMQGSIEHGKMQIVERYGSYETIECDNPTAYISEHTQLLKSLKSQIKEADEKYKTTQKSVNEYVLIQKDLERILKNAGIPLNRGGNADAVADVKDYENVSKEYDALVKSEYKKKEEFLKEKQKLVDELKKLNAHELSEEIAKSMEIPERAQDADELTEALKQTNEFIALEKDRVSRGIEDMERIKDNFENRCIQTCCNIKTELDRLPKLSRITLEEEVISIIGLSVPYVKEEFYKERMSSYINDTIAFSESFKNVEERLKYIRGRLTWKKLFSVIVTDMNGIRLNLYKRERIREQSRYLRYEEAVGSTGQSQGIYIQFLIAIINYISSINASIADASAVGNVIFIDNPFGAAKDVYIWEPIFKLLKVNHVQLIVPARGATPAITGRFDVNYILGQKLVDGRQQTVVVDYRSQIQNEEVEYEKLDYQQSTLVFDN